MNKSKILVILGPTSTGKSDLAVNFAGRFNGEIISVDSRQVYKGLDLGTGKITKKEMLGIPHHMLDLVSPKTIYNISKYKNKAQKIIADIHKRNKLPILCGGTGYYLEAVINNTTLPAVKPNLKLREKLEKKNCEKLIKILEKLDKQSTQKIDRKNKRKIIRAIEIATAIGNVPPIESKPLYDTLQIGLTLPDKILQKRIKLRLEKRIEAGMIAEVKNLHKQGLSWRRMENLGLEYRYLAMFLTRQLTLEQMKEQLNSKIWQYARRQKTWFKRNPPAHEGRISNNIIWINPLKKNDIIKTNKLVNNFLKK